jgi:hypothetical protein
MISPALPHELRTPVERYPICIDGHLRSDDELREVPAMASVPAIAGDRPVVWPQWAPSTALLFLVADLESWRRLSAAGLLAVVVSGPAAIVAAGRDHDAAVAIVEGGCAADTGEAIRRFVGEVREVRHGELSAMSTRREFVDLAARAERRRGKRQLIARAVGNLCGEGDT